MNKLYAILMTGRTADSENYYFKRHVKPVCPKVCKDIIASLFGSLSDSRMHFVAAAVCDMVMHTSFQKEILQLDSPNTYTPISRHDDELLYDVISPPDTREWIIKLLDADIQERLQLSNWPEFLGGVSLYLLRHTIL